MELVRSYRQRPGIVRWGLFRERESRELTDERAEER